MPTGLFSHNWNPLLFLGPARCRCFIYFIGRRGAIIQDGLVQ